MEAGVSVVGNSVVAKYFPSALQTSVCNSSSPYLRHMTGKKFWISIANSISMSCSLSHIMKL